jgi:preprotein translocase subunit YajC
MPQAGQNPQIVIVIWVLIFVVFYILMVRPQRVQARKKREMLDALKRGDRVVLIDGIHATIADIKDDVLSLDLAPNVRVKADKGSVSYLRSSKGEE